MPTIEIGGTRVAYTESGSGETVLLLHSSASSGAQWRSLAQSLPGMYRFLAPDLYGYGETDSWPGQGPIGLAEEAALADAVLAGTDDRVHLVGHSYGGAVALRFALQHGERLRSLTLIEPVAFHLLRGTTADAADRGLFGTVAEVAAVMSKATVTGDYWSAMAHFVDYWNGDGAWSRTKPELRAALARRTPKVALDFWATMTESTPRATYRRIGVPTLVLRGTESPPPTRRIAELIAGTLPEAHLRTIDGAGHMLPVTHRDAVNAAIAEHLLRTNADRQSPAAA